MTLEDALGGPITDLYDAFLARQMFHDVKHGADPFQARFDAQNRIEAMGMEEFLQYLSIALNDLKERKKR